MTRRTVLCAALLLLSGCALTSKADPVEVRYFSAEAAQSTAKAQGLPGQQLELRRVVGAGHIARRLATRVSAHEVVYSHTRQWSDEPPEFLRRGLELALFARAGLKPAAGGGAPVLDVTLVSFEVAGGKATVGVHAFLHEGRAGRIFRAVTVGRPVKDPDDPEAVAAACASALSEVVEQVAGVVVAELKTPR